MQALGKYVIVTPIKQEGPKGLILPSGKEKITAWKVISIGSECELPLDEGDEILCRQYGPERLGEDTELYAVPHESIVACKKDLCSGNK